MALADQRWLTIVGIGENGLTGLGEDAKRAIVQAQYVFGGKRHLQLAHDAITGQSIPWPTPFGIEPVLALRGTKVCVLASGDPFQYGVGATLAERVAPDKIHTIPAPSSFSLAAARLAWALQSVECVSLHGRSIDLLRPYLQPGQKILALTSDADAPARIAI